MQEIDVGKRLEKLFTDTFLYGWTDQTESEITELSSSDETEYREQVEAYLLERIEHRRSDKTSLLLSLVLFSRFGKDSFWLSNFSRTHLLEKLHLKDFRIIHLHLFENRIPLPDRLVFNITERIILDIESSYHMIVEDFKSVPLRNAEKTVLYLILHNCRIDLDTQNKEMICLIISHIKNVPIPTELVESMENFLENTFYARIAAREKGDVEQKEMKHIFFLERPIQEDVRPAPVIEEKTENAEIAPEKIGESVVRDDRAFLGNTLNGKNTPQETVRPEPLKPDPDAGSDRTEPVASPERPEIIVAPPVAPVVREEAPGLVLERTEAEPGREPEKVEGRPRFDFDRENRPGETARAGAGSESLLPLDSLYSGRSDRSGDVTPPDFSRLNAADDAVHDQSSYRPSRRETGARTGIDEGREGRKVRLEYSGEKGENEEGIHLGDIFDGFARFFGKKTAKKGSSDETAAEALPGNGDDSDARISETGDHAGNHEEHPGTVHGKITRSVRHLFRGISGLIRKNYLLIALLLGLAALVLFLFFFIRTLKPPERSEGREPGAEANTGISAAEVLENPEESAIIQNGNTDNAVDGRVSRVPGTEGKPQDAAGAGMEDSGKIDTEPAESGEFLITGGSGEVIWTVVPDDFIYKLYVKLQSSREILPEDIRRLSDLPWEDFFIEFTKLNPDHKNYSLIFPGQTFFLKSRD